ncbi:hypothetical protein F511_41687 [Dorcoceras hygrometricum]|uniref:Uncharacterized protein n=1 Tax=Dorcoceras hygrometricum TaxID=472368 RepID=A0A2Z6ZZG1_9LAMI|nr:hypothetical protein F511_41687 [Dorcoceras hygrometricum]
MKFDQWKALRTEVRLNITSSMMPIESMAKIEDDLMKWAETDKVSEQLLRRELVLPSASWSTYILPEWSIYGPPSDEQDPGITGGNLQQKTDQSSMNDVEQPAQDQPEDMDVIPITTKEHNAHGCNEESSSEAFLEERELEEQSAPKNPIANSPIQNKDFFAITSQADAGCPTSSANPTSQELQPVYSTPVALDTSISSEIQKLTEVVESLKASLSSMHLDQLFVKADLR